MGTFSFWDYVVLALVLIVSAGIGVYYRITGGQQKTTKEYLMADGKMSGFTVSFSLMASFMSAISLLGVSAESYQFGTQFVVINIAYVVSTPIAAYLFLPVFYKLQLTSVYEYLEMRFGRAARLVASISYSSQMILYMGIVLYAPAIALEAVTGLDKSVAILGIGLVCTFYSTIGGMKAVLITDILQSLLMFAAIYCVIIVAAVKANGFGPIWTVADEGQRLELWNFGLDPTIRHSWWSLIIGGSVIYLSLYGVNQTQIQRLLTVKSLKASQQSLWLNLPILSCLSFSTLFSGLSLYYYYKDCDPLLQGRISSRDQVMPLFVLDTMNRIPGLSGLFVSGIFSASLSTISNSVCSLAAVTLEDYMKPLYMHFTKRSMVESNKTLQSKIMSALYGLVCIVLAFAASSFGGVLQASLTIFGVVGGPLLALFTLGMFTTRANQNGAVSGFFIGLLFAFCIGFGGPKPPATTLEFTTDQCAPLNATVSGVTSSLMASNSSNTPLEYSWLFKISYLWYCVLGFLLTFSSGYVISIIYEMLNIDNNDCIYNDESRTRIKTELFVPPLARRLEAQMALHSLDPSAVKLDPNEKSTTEC